MKKLLALSFLAILLILPVSAQPVDQYASHSYCQQDYHLWLTITGGTATLKADAPPMTFCMSGGWFSNIPGILSFNHAALGFVDDQGFNTSEQFSWQGGSWSYSFPYSTENTWVHASSTVSYRGICFAIMPAICSTDVTTTIDVQTYVLPPPAAPVSANLHWWCLWLC